MQCVLVKCQSVQDKCTLQSGIRWMWNLAVIQWDSWKRTAVKFGWIGALVLGSISSGFNQLHDTSCFVVTCFSMGWMLCTVLSCVSVDGAGNEQSNTPDGLPGFHSISNDFKRLLLIQYLPLLNAFPLQWVNGLKN